MLADPSPSREGAFDPDHAAAMPPVNPSPAVAEAKILWSSTEGQVVNAGVFAIALLFCWLVIPVAWAMYCYLRTARHRYTLTDQRLLVESGILVKQVESVELYRIKDLSVAGTLLQSMFGRGQVILRSTDTTSPTLLINAVPNPVDVSKLIRDTVETCRVAKGVRAFDY